MLRVHVDTDVSYSELAAASSSSKIGKVCWTAAGRTRPPRRRSVMRATGALGSQSRPGWRPYRDCTRPSLDPAAVAVRTAQKSEAVKGGTGTRETCPPRLAETRCGVGTGGADAATRPTFPNTEIAVSLPAEAPANTRR